MMLIMYVALVVSYRLSFDSKNTTAWIIWEGIVDASFLVDLVMTFFTSYYDSTEGENVYSHRKIA